MADHLALAGAARLEFDHHLAGLQPHVFGVPVGQALRERAHGVGGLRQMAVVQREGDALGFEHHARHAGQLRAQFAFERGQRFAVGPQLMEAAVGMPSLGAVHAGDHQAGQGEPGFDVGHCAAADNGQRAIAGALQCGQRGAQVRRHLDGFRLRCDINERAVEVEQKGRARRIERRQRRHMGRGGGGCDLRQTGP